MTAIKMKQIFHKIILANGELSRVTHTKWAKKLGDECSFYDDGHDVDGGGGDKYHTS